MNYPPMTATVAERTATRVSLDIEHHPAQSYSRSVEPRAMKEAQRVLPRTAQWALTDVNYDIPAPTGRATSRYIFEAR